MNEQPLNEFNRRNFLKGSSLSTLMMLLGGVPLRAEDKPKAEDAPPKPTGPAVPCGVIGCGLWGRDILKTLAAMPRANVVAVCDDYEPFLKRGAQSAPKAEKFSDYLKLLDQKDIKGVIVATPTHKHRDIVVAALKAGKHVYCETPLASTVEDARAIAHAAQSATKLNFQSGLQLRSDPQRHFLLEFVRSGAMGQFIKVRAQWHKKQSWRRTSPTSEREKALNWRLYQATSSGLMGEIGVHHLDAANWFLNERPKAVTGFGEIMHWRDDRNVHDTIQAILEYPSKVRLTYDCTLASSFDTDYEIYYGTYAATMIRENKAWLFKEVDSPLLGWEVYARKDTFYKETGIALVANATKLVAQGDKPVEEAPYSSTPLFYSLEAFLANTDVVHSGVEDFLSNFGDGDKNALKEYVADLGKSRMPAAGFKEGYEATVAAIKANEAIVKGERIVFADEWFKIS